MNIFNKKNSTETRAKLKKIISSIEKLEVEDLMEGDDNTGKFERYDVEMISKEDVLDIINKILKR